MFYLEDIPGRVTTLDDVSYLFFSGFAYLGMPSLAEFQKIVKKGVEKYGSVFPSSRLSNTPHRLYEDFEKELSDAIGCPASASFSSGYVASIAAVHFVSRNRRLYGLRGIHPSLHQGNKISLLSDTESIIEAINSSDEDSGLVLESVHPLTGELSRFDWLKNINKSVYVVVDDSHGIGVLGQQGEGVKSYLPDNSCLKYIFCYSLSKAYSCQGGAVSGEEGVIAEIKSVPPFSASTPISPAYAYAWMESQTLFKKQGETLKERLQFLKNEVSNKKNITFDGRLPVCRISKEGIYEKALKENILLSAFRYPTEKDPLKVRAVINALHTEKDLEQLVHCIKNK